MQSLSLKDVQEMTHNWSKVDWYDALCEAVGKENVIDGFAEKLAYGRDRWPYANLKYRFGEFPCFVPLLIVFPGTYEEVRNVLIIANENRVPVVPYGFGSGVLGGAAPVENGLVLDLKRLNNLVGIDEICGLATAQAGMNGELFEAALNKRKLTLGHFPQSLNISTVGGWLSCRSAGQASTRYGKIEDMVVGLKVALSDGRFLEIEPAPRRAVGPSIKDIFVGAEGTMGIILEGTFRVLPYPERESIHAVAFKDYLTGLEALRRIMQAELRPAVLRLYDEHESYGKIAEYPEYSGYSCLAMLSFMGLKELVEVEEELSLKICKELGGTEGSPEPVYKWMEHRYESLSAKPVSEGRMMDTIEIAAPWIALPEIYEGAREMIREVNPEAHFGAHWSHMYPDGGCMYMTFIIPASNDAKATSEHSKIWENIMQLTLKEKGTISHHHGIGYFRSKWLVQELGIGHDILKDIKSVLDPNHILNPGKLAL